MRTVWGQVLPGNSNQQGRQARPEPKSPFLRSHRTRTESAVAATGIVASVPSARGVELHVPQRPVARKSGAGGAANARAARLGTRLAAQRFLLNSVIRAVNTRSLVAATSRADVVPH
jgi:hypothetical protein